MDGAPRSRRSRILAVVGVVLAVGLAVVGTVVLSGDDDSKRPAAGPGPTSGLATVTTAPSPAPTSTPAPTTTEAPSPTEETPGATTGSGPGPGSGGATAVGPGYDSEACALMRQLLAIVDDPGLRAGAAEVGCI